jgi:hypothetical protein
MSTRPSFGDIFEIPLPYGCGYGQYLLEENNPKKYCEFVRVFRGVRTARPRDLEVLSQETEQFQSYYPLRWGIKHARVLLIGNAPIPEHLNRIPQLKTYGKFEQKPQGRILSWIIGSGPYPEFIEDSKLTDEQRHMPLAQIISHATLVSRIESGWSQTMSTIDI